MMPCSILNAKRRFRRTYQFLLQGKISPKRYQCESLPPAFMLVSCSAYLNWKMETKCSSKTSADFKHTTSHYIPEDSTLYNYCCENLKSCIKWKRLIKRPKQGLDDNIENYLGATWCETVKWSGSA
jgi:hypothetical protein